MVTIVLGVFLLLCIGVGLFYQVEKQIIHKEVAKKIETGFVAEDLLNFHVSKAEIETKFRWVHSHEFEYDGAMYDIVERNETTDSVNLICFLDDKETKLLRRMEKMKRYVFGLDSENNYPENTPKFQVKLPFLFFNQTPRIAFNSYLTYKKLLCLNVVSFYQSIYLSPLNPPPINS